MANLNKNYKNLQNNYLFAEIAKRTNDFIQKNPNKKIYKLGIGDTTEALAPIVIEEMHKAVKMLSKNSTYQGYGVDGGSIDLRNALCSWYSQQGVEVDSNEIFISDGAKTDTSNIASIFDSNSVIAIQDPVYPVYLDSNVIGGLSGNFEKGRYKKIVYMDCNQENGFFPSLPTKHVDLIFICSPNNPTGVAATREQLKEFVDYANKNNSIIIFDSAYSAYIKNNKYPKSIYEIPGAKKCSIEISSFSKSAGFTGVRLGWTVVPRSLKLNNVKQGEVTSIWARRQSTMFNGASSISQAGGIAVLTQEGQMQCQKIINYYMENARIIREGLEDAGFSVWGGENAPYIWLKIPGDISSWEFFDQLLLDVGVIGTPGSGFGKNGEGYFRLSAFGHRGDIVTAVNCIKKKFSNMKNLYPFTQEMINKIISNNPTPFHIYDEARIRKNARRLIRNFSWSEGFKEYFAVKALPNPFILKILRQEGFGVDCSSMAELILAEKVGFRGEEIMFSSNDTPIDEYSKAKQLGAIINLDDISHIDFISSQIKLPNTLCFRYNPGRLREGNSIIGNPIEAKYGLTKDQIIQAYKKSKNLGVKKFGLHTMIASNELNPQYFIDTAKMLFDLVIDVKRLTGIEIEFINLGGGIGIPYKPGKDSVDIELISQGIRDIYETLLKDKKIHGLNIFMENGRVITGPYGYLISKVIHKKSTYKEYIGLDACMANLMRPGMYGAYHHITVLGKENEKKSRVYDVTGSLCENNDKFAIDRNLPEVEIGNYIVIHDTGAHGHAMGFNYNGKLRSAELLLRPDGKVIQIRRAESIDDLFATLDFNKLNNQL